MTVKRGWSNRSSASDGRISGRRLQKAREELYRRYPHCWKCHISLPLSQLERDHTINLADGGTDDTSNTRLLCIPCHQAKTQAESNKARGITTKPRMHIGCDVTGRPLSRDHHWNK